MSEPSTVATPPPVSPSVSSGDMTFDNWRAQFADKAVAAGVPVAVVQRELAGLTPDPTVVSLDRRSPNSPALSATTSRA